MTTSFRNILFYLILVFVPLQAFSQTDQTRSDVATAASVFETIFQNNSFVESLLQAVTSDNVLPVGFHRVQNNIAITIAVHRGVGHSQYRELSLFAKVVLPQNGNGSETTLFFGANDVKFSRNGSIDAHLVLLEDITIPFNNGNMSLVLLGDYSQQTGQSHSATYMSISCSGFEELSLNAKIMFPETLLQRVDQSGGSRAVYGHFQTVLQDWNDIVATVSLPPFQVTGLDGFVFTLENVVFDFSDFRNGEGFSFPPGYERFLVPGAHTLWRGVYAQRLNITLPEAFNDASGRPVRFSAQNMLIDDNGITGLFTAENILSFDNGSADGWNFSVDAFLMRLEANRLLEAGFEGEIGLPFYGDRTRLKYTASIREGNEYIMSVQPAEKLDFSLFGATATIYQNSYVKLHLVNNRFRPEANLHGHMAIVGSDEIPVSIPRLDFRELRLTTQAPYISVGSLGYSGTASLGISSHFGMSLSNIALRNNTGSGRVELVSDVGITLAQDMFSGNTSLAFLTLLEDNNGRQRWRSAGVHMDKINLQANIANTVKLDGTIGWQRNDPTYGDGFFGDMAVTVEPINLTVNMGGGFGRVDGFNYWFVEGSTELPRGIPIMVPLQISGFSGAVSQRMRGVGNSPQGGSAFSSAFYVPDRNRGLGLQASVLLKIGEIGNGEASFDIAFNDRGGLDFIGFYGFAEFAPKKEISLGGSLTDKYKDILQRAAAIEKSALDNLKRFNGTEAAQIVMPIPSGRMGIMGSIGIQYDFRNSTFHARTELFINTPGNFFSGNGARGRAGWGEFFISPNEWYMHLGSPDDRLGVRFGLGNASISAGAYLMAGSRIPAMPAPPQQVADILGRDLSSLTMGRNIAQLGTGRGFAFGSDFRVSTGDINFLILYANFMAGLGFDIMLQDYGYAVCAQTGRPIGMGGWYAMGQTYAYLQGELGVRVNVGFIRTRIPIIQGGAAALMQAGLPNPAYFKGYLGVQFRVLGGLVKGNMRFRISLGEECTPLLPGGSPLQMQMISDMAPADRKIDVNVFTSPQVTFNTVVGESFESEGNIYRIRLRSFTLQAENGAPIVGTLEWNSDRTAVSFLSHDVLPPSVRITAHVEVGFDRFSNGQWTTVVTAGADAVESKTIVFTTGEAPNYIPLKNIAHSYPVVEQQYFLPGESRNGSVQLRQGQPYLFERGFNYRLVFTGADGQSLSTNFTNNPSTNRLTFTIPELRTGQQYTLQLVYTPADANAGTAGAGAQTQQLLTDGGDDSLLVERREAFAGVNADIEESILDYGFSTSRHTTFRQKIASMNTDGGSVAQDVAVAFRYITYVRADEAFDEAEVVGVTHSGNRALIRARAELREPFFAQTAHTLMYSGYPFGNIRLTHRDDAVMGVPPVRSVFIYAPYLNMIANGQRPPQRFRFPFAFESAIVAERDFRNLQHLVGNAPNASDDLRRRFLANRLPFLQYGRYRVFLKYVLPDGTVTSEAEFFFYNFLRFNE